MARDIQPIFAFNRGVVSRLGLARIDVKRLAMAAQVQTNWLPRVLGAMSLRAGWQYIYGVLNNSPAKYLKFIFATDDTALLELTANTLRISISDVLLTRPAVATTIANGTFAVSLASWTSYDDAGAVSSWVAPNYMQLVGTGTSRAIREQAVAAATPGVEHALRIVIARGPVTMRIGSTSGDDDYVGETVLNEGTHSIAFTPIGTFYVRFFSLNARLVWVSQCTIEAAGVVTLPTPWGASDLSNIRTDQSADVIFAACKNYRQRRIERRGVHPGGRSWSVVKYFSNDGPFQLQNVSPTTLTASAITGNITLTASLPMFKATHVGALFSLTSVGQDVKATGAVNGVFTSAIRVTGIGTARTFSIVITGIAAASTVSLQRSYDNAVWANVGGTWVWTANASTTCADGLDNQIVYYRLILTTRVAPDSVTMELIIGSGSVRGVVRVTDYTSSTSVGAEVLVALGGTSATTIWQEGQWSDKKGWPTAVRIHEGRMWWTGLNGVWGSISDAYDSFDETFVGDAGPINRTVGSGPVDTINWIVSLKGMLLGSQGAEYSVRASSLDEPLTPTNFNMKTSSTQGSGPVDGIKIDQNGYFVNRSNCKVFDLSFDLKAYDYYSTDLMALAPEIGLPGIVRMDCQRLPDTRLHCVRTDGTVIIAVLDKSEDVLAWIPVTTSGFVEDVVILPAIAGNLDDQVYYVVRRTINGATVRYLEKWAQEIDCRGDKQLCKLADAHITYSGAATTVITGLSHLEGQKVVVWADGADVGTDDTVVPWVQRYTVSGGQITLATAASNVVVGLGYTSQFQSAKLGSQGGVTPLNQQKKTHHIGLILADTHPRGVQFGPSFDYLDDMPLIEDGTTVGTATETDYDQNFIEFPGTWTTDSRLCLQGQAPRPCTVVAATLDMDRYS
ncbi:hypothetical protein UFOVP241_10 [uncultured Caudovirales phage]|uniref:Uncharacterized protein n=1 Tax=uncultured Caudovirales phage TaxID=2100421 RepID=A0A6J7WVB9_9CAUD|nr:hypothetical protein UFOVP241_10 [uncultured Caudovirales phage]